MKRTLLLLAATMLAGCHKYNSDSISTLESDASLTNIQSTNMMQINLDETTDSYAIFRIKNSNQNPPTNSLQFQFYNIIEDTNLSLEEVRWNATNVEASFTHEPIIIGNSNGMWIVRFKP